MTQSEIKALASEMVGDGESPNKFFVTSTSYIKAYEDHSFSLCDELLEGCSTATDETVGPFDTYEEARVAYEDIDLDADIGIGSAIIEDREYGIICEKFLKKIVSITYVEDEYNDYRK